MLCLRAKTASIITIIIIFARELGRRKTRGGGGGDGFWVHDLSREPGDFDAAPVYRLAEAEAAAAAADVTRPYVGGGWGGG